MSAPRFPWHRLLVASFLATLVGGLAPRAWGEPTPGCFLAEPLAAGRPALAARLERDTAFRLRGAGGRDASFAAWCKAVDRALTEAGSSEALAEWRRFRALGAAERAADPAFPVIVAEYAALRYGPDLQAALTALVGCRTVGTIEQNPAGFARARAVVDSVAAAHGVTTVASGDGRALTLSFGAALPAVTFWGYLDTPPTGAGWSGDPWRCTFSDSAWVGRGVAEGKGPSVAALFALRAAWDATGERPPAELTLRLDALSTLAPISAGAGTYVVLGGSATGAGLRQRARLTFRITTNYDQMDLRPTSCLWRLDAIRTEWPGARVPTFVELLVTPVGRTVNLSVGSLRKRINAFNGENSRARLDLRRDGELLYINATGRQAPGSRPELGENPIVDLAMFLQELGNVCQTPAGLTAIFLAENIDHERNGRGLGISRKSETGVATTLTVTDLGAAGDSAWTEFELYHPGVQPEEEMLAEVRERLKVSNDHYGAGLRVSITARTPAVTPVDPAAEARLATLAADCAAQPVPPPAASEWSGRWNLPGAIPLGTLSPPDRPNNLVDERTTPALVTAWLARVVRVIGR